MSRKAVRRVKVLTGRWIEERKKDYFYRKAKQEGYRSRASYKLLQANLKYCFIKVGQKVVDLGCAPGGWLQVVSPIIGPTGLIVGVDLKPIDTIEFKNVHFLQADVLDSELLKNIQKIVGKKLDVVLSDLSQNISGIWEVDNARQIDLARKALFIAKALLKKDGTFFVKVFEGPLLEEFIGEIKRKFKDVKIIKPKASKAKSAELYLLNREIKSGKA